MKGALVIQGSWHDGEQHKRRRTAGLESAQPFVGIGPAVETDLDVERGFVLNEVDHERLLRRAVLEGVGAFGVLIYADP